MKIIIVLAIIYYLEITTTVADLWIENTKLFYSKEYYITPSAIQRAYNTSKFDAIFRYAIYFIAAPVNCIINILEWYFIVKRKDH